MPESGVDCATSPVLEDLISFFVGLAPLVPSQCFKYEAFNEEFK
jgi:hypothetical protein